MTDVICDHTTGARSSLRCDVTLSLGDVRNGLRWGGIEPIIPRLGLGHLEAGSLNDGTSPGLVDLDDVLN